MQSVTADFYSEEDRGKVFGTLHLTSAAGAAFGGLYATNMGESLGWPWYEEAHGPHPHPIPVVRLPQ